MIPQVDIDMSILGLDPATATEVYKRINIVAHAYSADGHTVTLTTTTYTPEEDDDDMEDEE